MAFRARGAAKVGKKSEQVEAKMNFLGIAVPVVLTFLQESNFIKFLRDCGFVVGSVPLY